MPSPIDLTRFDFHVVRFMNSYNVDLMTDAEVGQYLLLLCKAWLLGHDASLPDDLDYLARIARTKKVSDRVLACFPLVDTPEGKIRQNKALLEEWNIAVKRSDVAKKRAQGRWGKEDEEGEELEQNSSSAAVLLPEIPQQSYRENLADAHTNPNQSTQSNHTKPISLMDEVSFDQKAKNQGGDWKTLRIRHKRIFGSQAAIVHQEKYDAACRKYGEDVVLECFEDWALESKDWVETNRVKQPLFAFWKKVNELAETVIAVKSEEKAEAEVAAAAEQERAKQAVETTAAIEEQIRRNIEHMNAVPDPGNVCEDLPELPEETE